jgi:phage-related protein
MWDMQPGDWIVAIVKDATVFEARFNRRHTKRLELLIEEGVEAGVQWVEDRAWSLVRRYAPQLEPILRQGIVEWLKEKIGSAIEAVWNTLMAPVRSVTDFVASLRAHFRNLVDWMREAAAKLARGDCSSIAEAAQKVHDVVAGLAAPVIDRVKHAAKRVGDFFTGLWERFGAPVWQWLRRLGGAIWERIQSFASWLWEKTQPIRDALSRAWSWIKDKLGIGSGPEGQNGLLQWVQRKAGEAWDWLKARLEPYKRQLLAIAGVLVLLSPAGPVIALGAAVGGLIYGARWLAQHLRSRDAVVRDRGVLEGRIIPGIQHAVEAVAGGVARAAAWLTGKLQAVVGHLSSAAGAIAGSILRFALGAITWLLDRFRSLAAWASEQVQGLAAHVRSGLGRLHAWLEPLFAVLRALGRVVADVFNIVALVLTRVWHAIPACIRNPIVDFVTSQILRRVPIFSSLLAIPDIWTKIRATALRVIRQVFRDGDLAGAAMTVFRFLLDVLQVPVDLVRAIFSKAAGVLDLILGNPIRFLRNVLSALKQGFVQFFASIGRHLLSGVVNWLFGQLREAGITVPADLSFRSIFRLVLDVLGITLDRVLAILARKVGRPLVDRIRRLLGVLTGVWEFVARLVTEGPAGLWRYLVERLSNLWDTVRDMIVGWITTTIIGRVTARILTMLDPTGIMAVVNSIIAFYRAIQSALEYLRQILEIVDRWFDTLASIAAGAVAGAATMFENLLDRALPVAIGFLANQVGLRGLGRRIHEMIAAVQARIESAIEWLIDRALAGGRAILERLGLAPSPAQQADDPQKAALKRQALATVAERARGLRSYDEFHEVLAAVLAQYRPQGLLTLSARAEGAGDARIEATASNGVPITLPMRQIFTPDELSEPEVEALLDAFVGIGPPSIRNETYAALVVDGQMRATATSAENHAEQSLIESGDFGRVVLAAHHESHTEGDRPVLVTLIVNRAPCTACTRALVGAMNQIEIGRGTGMLLGRVRYVLAATGPYEPMNRAERSAMAAQIARELIAGGLPKEEALLQARRDPRMPESRMLEERTRFAGLQTLAAAGWELSQLQQHADRQTQFNMILAEAIRNVRLHAQERFDELERVR